MVEMDTRCVFVHISMEMVLDCTLIFRCFLYSCVGINGSLRLSRLFKQTNTCNIDNTTHNVASSLVSLQVNKTFK